MAGEIMVRLGAAWATSAAIMIGLWLWSRRITNAAWVDVGWAGSFAVVIGVWTVGFGTPEHAVGLAIVIAAWMVGVLSSAFVVPRVAAPHGDGRGLLIV